MELKKAIESFEICRELMLFNPNNGEIDDFEKLNEENKELYLACGLAIDVLSQMQEREKPCNWCSNTFYIEMLEGIINSTFEVDNTKVYYCHNCGRDLKKE